MLNRAPTLHRLGIQAFEPVLTEGRALKLHPLACTAYNADFDGDQMAIHLPLSSEAQAEARVLMLAANHILAPKDGKPIIVPTQDMVLGTYYLTKLREGAKGSGGKYTGLNEALMAYESGELALQAPIWVRQGPQLVQTSVGRLIFNEKLPKELRYNEVMNKKELGQLVARCYKAYGATRTAEVIDEVKRLGYHYACIAGMTVAVSDCIVPPQKAQIIGRTQEAVRKVESYYQRGILTERERYDKVVSLWNGATEAVAEAMMANMDAFNPIYMMSDSGARGNKQQMRQLAGMRGLMADPSGKIIDLPITANFREGLSVSDYFISSHGARKGLADTALRTADSGYLTRRLVDVAQDVIVRENDCDVSVINLVLARAAFAEDTFDALEILSEYLMGRVIAADVKRGDALIIPADTILDEEKLIQLGESGVQEIEVRGTNLTHEAIILGDKGKKASFLREYVGKELASNGEVLTEELLESYLMDDSIEYLEIRNKAVRGIEVEAIKEGSRGVIESLKERILGRYLAEEVELTNRVLPVNTLITEELADEICAFRERVKIRSVLTCRCSQGVCKACYGEDLANRSPVEIGEAVGIIAAQSIGEPGTQLTMRTFHTGGVAGGDITQGLPRVEELFEARKPKNAALIAEISGVVRNGEPDKNGLRTLIIEPVDGENQQPREYSIPYGVTPRVKEGDSIEAGDPITDGPKNPHDILRICGLKETHRYLVKEVQKVYKSQGVEINDKHIEVMVRQMLHKVTGNLELFFESFTFGESKYSLEECKKRDGTYAAPVRVRVKLLNKSKGDVKEQEVFMGDFPIMTSTGTFIINGAERVIVSQLVRSPGAYYTSNIDQNGHTIFNAQVIPNRGAWIELETDSNSAAFVRIDRTRKMPVSFFLRALDFHSNQLILDLFDINFFISSKLSDPVISKQLIAFILADSEAHNDSRNSILINYLHGLGSNIDSLFDQFQQLDDKFDSLSNSKFLLDLLYSIDDKNSLTAGYKAFVDALDSDKKNSEDNKERALLGVYARLRPGEPPSADNALSLLNSQFFDTRRYDLATVGRYKITKKLGWKARILGLQLAEDLIDLSSGELLIPKDTTVSQDLLDAIPDDREQDIFGLIPDNQRRGFYYPIKIRVHSPKGDFTLLCSPTLNIHDNRTLCVADITSSVNYIFSLMAGIGHTDDIDHLGNRRVRAVGELLQNQFRIGMTRMERVVRERMTTQDSEIITPQNLINIRPVVAAIKEFFGSSQLSQFMDQHNPLSELTHKRRLSALGPGGLSRERAGFEVRDVHISHYGRMCPIETPEGPNIGLIGSLSNYARVNQFGFIETPYRIIRNDATSTRRFVSNDIVYLTADEEEKLTIAQANEPLDDSDWFLNERVTARVNEQTTKVNRDSVDLMDVSPKQVVSIATALIPFLENDDANRALMGANMQRQAVPLLKTQAPLVGTGMEFKAACDSGVMILAKRPGIVTELDSDHIKVKVDSQFVNSPRDKFDIYHLQKFVRSNQGTCINQIPIVSEGEHIDAGQPIADGPATSNGELALGYNIIVAYMPWEGYNYEDAILLSENLIKRDIYTSIHIEEYQCDARDTKLGPEEVTRDIPNVAEDSLIHLDSEGIIAIGADVRTGDILVGKVTPKGETELTAEERLLRAIFGEKAREVRDTSLRVPHGESGKVVAVTTFTRDNNDEMAPGVNKQVRVYIAQKRKISVGDKMSGRHGNKGVVSDIRRQEDMPFLPDGTPVDIVLNPLGVPSRMNIGQILETHLGMAVRLIGLRIRAIPSLLDKIKTDTRSIIRRKFSLLHDNPKLNIPDFDSLTADILSEVAFISRSLYQAQQDQFPDTSRLSSSVSKLKNYLLANNIADFKLTADISSIENSIKRINKIIAEELDDIKRDLLDFGFDVHKYGLPQPSDAGLHIATPVFDGANDSDLFATMKLAGMDSDGKTILYDGRTGLPFENRVTVGCVYMLKLHHLVDDKIHARSTGPYSLVTQQPLGGKAQFGGQRFGEMEVWALEAYGASYTLQEILTVKSDDVVGRVKAYEAIVKGQNIPEPGVPESFKVLIKELQSIGLDIRVLSKDSKEIIIKDDDEDEPAIKKTAIDMGVDVGNFGDHDVKAPPQPDTPLDDLDE